MGLGLRAKSGRLTFFNSHNIGTLLNLTSPHNIRPPPPLNIRWGYLGLILIAIWCSRFGACYLLVKSILSALNFFRLWNIFFFLVLDVRMAIPMVMGANIGTSLTSTLVSLTQVRKFYTKNIPQKLPRCIACGKIMYKGKHSSLLGFIRQECKTCFKRRLPTRINLKELLPELLSTTASTGKFFFNIYGISWEKSPIFQIQ